MRKVSPSLDLTSKYYRSARGPLIISIAIIIVSVKMTFIDKPTTAARSQVKRVTTASGAMGMDAEEEEAKLVVLG